MRPHYDNQEVIIMEEKKKEEKKELVAICNRLVEPIESRILTVRGVQVILDRDLADLYDITTKRLNEQVRRNLMRFPASFRFQLTKAETDEVIAKCNRFQPLRFSTTTPYAFTEQGVAMLSAVLHTQEAIDTSIRIINAFVAMRHFLLSNAQLFQRMDRIEYKLFEHDQKLEQVFVKLEEKTLEPQQGIFYDGQIYDSYAFINALIKSAINRIVLIDNYIDDTVLTMMDKRNPGVEATIYTLKISNQLQLDITKHDAQYPAIPVKVFSKSHDRFLIIDDKVYHLGASLKDLGKKWFAFSLMEETMADDLLSRL